MDPLTKLSDLKWGSEVRFPSSRSLTKTPHFVGGRYPCRSVAYVPRMILEDLGSVSERFRVLDPFMGSGTTAVEAVRCAAGVYGVEIDPYARLIASVASRKYQPRDIKKIHTIFSDIQRKFSAQRPSAKFRPQLANIEYWFDQENFSDLLKLRGAISNTVDGGRYKDFFSAALGDIVRACSKAERQSLKPYISRKYIKQPKPVWQEFSKTVFKYLDAISDTANNNVSGIKWVNPDATNFKIDALIDVAITSPPYINAMDYTRCIKLESAWVGTADDEAIRAVRRSQLGEGIRRHRVVGDRAVLDAAKRFFGRLEDVNESKYKTAVAFFDDMKRNLRAVMQALRSGGTYHVIVGNSRICGIEVPTHQVLVTLSEDLGYTWDKYFTYRIKDHRTSIPRGNHGGKIEVEHVIGLKKP